MTAFSTSYNLIIIDESGSMEPLRQAVVTGFSEIIQTIQGSEKQFPQQSQRVTLVTFNGLGIRTLVDRQPASQIKPLTLDDYQPDASTPLYDTLGQSLMRLSIQLEGTPNASVLVSILTDGEENASREFSISGIQALIGRLKSQGWLFTYMGANHDVTTTASQLGMHASLSFAPSPQGFEELLSQEKASRMAYYQKKNTRSFTEEDRRNFFLL